ncbi:LpqB family beta-propeller domain-containing protein [Microbacterium neungamense]|uniref:LpqB family beta-propeller domain-containing protein n=1 Tax=Microbacterium neungamense TaxID=2810535 RepID=UPI00217E7411|nr:LpqB family beta-propeller domain-containing protein [Microbacterium neungamense]UWF78212.1 GerMN domain-containing protein [Microbacterium neungamense]
MRLTRTVRAAALAAAALLLAGCAGLPTSGPPNIGLPLGDGPTVPEYTEVAEEPVEGASPKQIVAGFLEAGVTPDGDWAIAREFLTEELARTWKAGTGVTIDDTLFSRLFSASTDGSEEAEEEATESDVSVRFNQVASVDATGAYTEQAGQAQAAFHLVRVDGEWRIAEAPDGIVLDSDSFAQVYDSHALQYFDATWSRLVPDVRWFPRRGSMATSITRALVTGEPAPWLAPAVRSAFTGEIGLDRNAVPVDSSQVAEVSLNRAALSIDPTTLARMRTQLEASLADLGVSEVRLLVDGSPLDAARAPLAERPPANGVLVLTDDAFGTAVGDEVTPVPALTAQIGKIPGPIAAIDVEAGGAHAAVQLADGTVSLISDGHTNVLDTRPDLAAPSMDPYGYTWTVPRDQPQALLAWDAEVVSHEIAQAWPDAAGISHLRVSADGARVAAVLSVGGQRRIVVAAVIRDEDGTPVELGAVHEVGRIENPALGLGWLGADALVVLTDAQDPSLVTQTVGGPATVSGVPVGAQSVAGASTPAGVRVLTSSGVVYAQRGSSWQESTAGVLVLGTRAGY